MRLLLATIFLLILGKASAQILPADSLINSLSDADSLITKPQEKLDSINTGFQQKSDSLQQELQDGLSKIENAKASVQSKIDSLSGLNLPTEKYTAKLDSLNGEANELVSSVNGKLEKLKTSTLGKVNELQLPPELKSQADKLTGSISGFDLPGIEGLDLSNLKLPEGLSNVDIGNLGDLNMDGVSKITENLNLPEATLPDVGNVSQLGTDQLAKIEGLENVSGITEQAGGYSEDIKSITNGDIEDVKQIPQALEKEVMQREELGALTEGTAVLDEYKGMAESIKDPEAMKEIAIEKAQEVAIDHFAGKQQQLSAAMEKIAKYKQKYSSVNSIKDLAKKPPNPMKSKPFIERIVPGINFQILKKNDLLVDFNPYALYRITGRLSAGAGWNYRLAYNDRDNQFNKAARIFGPRAFGEFKIGKGFTGHFSIEVMNTNTPPIIGLTSTPLDPEHREWVWGSFAGMKKEYKLFKNVRGTATILYNLYNPDYKSPYADQINMRFGFEFPMKKKVSRNKR